MPGDEDLAARSPGLVVIRRPAVVLVRSYYAVTKRIMDLSLCVLLLPAAAPLMLLCAALVRIDSPGPVWFAQERTGRGGRRFRMYKFRTMCVDAEARKQELAHLNELTWPDFKISRDPRITRIGRMLRRTSLDELPQIINVLKGDMSLVGPRPTSFHVNTYDLGLTERLEVMPGVTGLWQISGRSNLDLSERLRLDIRYIEQRCISLDLEILCRTIVAVFGQRGAC